MLRQKSLLVGRSKENGVVEDAIKTQQSRVFTSRLSGVRLWAVIALHKLWSNIGLGVESIGHVISYVRLRILDRRVSGRVRIEDRAFRFHASAQVSHFTPRPFVARTVRAPWSYIGHVLYVSLVRRSVETEFECDYTERYRHSECSVWVRFASDFSATCIMLPVATKDPVARCVSLSRGYAVQKQLNELKQLAANPQTDQAKRRFAAAPCVVPYALPFPAESPHCTRVKHNLAHAWCTIWRTLREALYMYWYLYLKRCATYRKFYKKTT